MEVEKRKTGKLIAVCKQEVESEKFTRDAGRLECLLFMLYCCSRDRT